MPGKTRFKGVVYGIPLTRDIPSMSKLLEEKGLIPRSAQEVRQRLKVHDRLNTLGQDAAAGIKRGDEFDGARMLVPVMAIRPYDRNPRKSINPKFDEIKESIRAVGLLTPFNITRRPGDEHYIVYGGGNTRLIILQQLFQEGLKQFEHVEVTYRAWRGEAHAIAGHIGENDQRGDMCFWDKAAGIFEIKSVLEAESGTVLSLRSFEAELKRLGLSVSVTNIALMKFALDHLEPLGYRLTGLDVKRIQPRVNALKRLAALWEIDETQFYEEIINPVMHEHVLALAPESGAEAERLMRRWEAALAARIGVDEPRLAKMMAALERSPGASRSDLETLDARSWTAPPPPHFTDAAPSLRQDAVASAATPEETAATPIAVPSADEEEQPSARRDPPEEGVNDLRQSLHEIALRLARAGDVAGHFVVSDAMPFGYYMEAGPLPHDRGDTETTRVIWWLLACASGQLDPELAQRLPSSSRWRRVYLQEGGMDESAYPFMVEDDLLAYSTQDGLAALDPWSLLYFLQNDAIAKQCLELAQLAARARAADPKACRHLLEATHRKG